MTWEIDLVRWLQSFPGLLLPMAAVSALGSPAFYLGLIAVIAWWRERSFALELSLLFAVSAIVNDLAKLVVHAPRPYWVSADVVPLELQDSFGFPSAHAQLAISMWGLIALRLGGPWAALAAAAVVVAVGISRIALGVHYPVDVLGGWLIGAAVLAAFVTAGPAAFRAAGRLTPRGRVVAAFVLSLAAVGASAAVAAAIGPWAPDPSWTGLVAGLAPVSIEYTLIAAGFGLGLVLGHELDRGCRSFRSRAGRPRRDPARPRRHGPALVRRWCPAAGRPRVRRRHLPRGRRDRGLGHGRRAGPLLPARPLRRRGPGTIMIPGRPRLNRWEPGESRPG